MTFSHPKLLSHRLRGLSKFEHTLPALERACEMEIPYLEVDTRVCADRGLVVYHNPETGSDLSRQVWFRDHPMETIRALEYESGEKIPTLDEFLALFSERSNPHQMICLDIKDYGFEKEHLELIHKYDLQSRVVIISWIPQVLMAFAELKENIPLVLSHTNLMKLGLLGRILGKCSARLFLRIRWYVLLGQGKYLRLPCPDVGYLHSLVCYGLPPEMLKTLASAKGGICIHVNLICKRIIDFCRREGLSLWVFSARDKAHFQKLSAIDAVDVVFCDDVTKVLN